MDLFRTTFLSRFGPGGRHTRLASHDPFQGLPQQKKGNYEHVPESGLEERFRIHKIRMRWICLVGLPPSFLIVIGTASSFCKAYGAASEWSCSSSALPEMIIFIPFALYWTVRHLLILLDRPCPWQPALFTKFPNKFPWAFPQHPGWFVTAELLLSACLAGTGISTALDAAVYVTYYGEDGRQDALIHDNGNALTKLLVANGFMWAAGMIVAVVGLVHFVLFALACDDEHARRTASNLPAVRKRAQQLASEIISLTKSHGTMRRRHPSGSIYDQERGRARGPSLSSSISGRSGAGEKVDTSYRASPFEPFRHQQVASDVEDSTKVASKISESTLVERSGAESASGRGHRRGQSSMGDAKRKSKFPGLVSKFNESFERDSIIAGAASPGEVLNEENRGNIAPPRNSWEGGFEEITLSRRTDAGDVV